MVEGASKCPSSDRYRCSKALFKGVRGLKPPGSNGPSNLMLLGTIRLANQYSVRNLALLVREEGRQVVKYKEILNVLSSDPAPV